MRCGRVDTSLAEETREVSNSEKGPKVVTPLGIAVWPHLNKPNDKFGDDASYQVKLKLPTAEAKAFLKQAVQLFRAYCKENAIKKIFDSDSHTKGVPGCMEKDEAGEETGNMLISFKARAWPDEEKSTLEKVVYRPLPIFDSNQSLLPGDLLPSIGSGSELKVSCRMDCWHGGLGAGVSFRIQAIQLVTLVEYSGNGGGASSYGFGEEKGYVSKSVEETSESTADAFDF